MPAGFTEPPVNSDVMAIPQTKERYFLDDVAWATTAASFRVSNHGGQRSLHSVMITHSIEQLGLGFLEQSFVLFGQCE